MQDEVNELEQQRKDYLKLIEQKDKITRLLENPDFQTVIMRNYCVEECARYLGVSGDPALSKEDRELAEEMAKACQHFKRWISIQVQMGNHASDNLAELDQAILETSVEDK